MQSAFCEKYIPMSRTQFTWSSLAVIVCGLMLHGCQQPQLNVVGDETTQKSPPAPQELTLTSEQNTEATATKEHELSSTVLTISSDSSPDAKHADPAALDLESTAQPIANVSQGNTLAPANTDTTMTEASREVVRKRPSTTRVGKHDEKLPATKQTKKEAEPLSHEEWFTLFADAIKRMERDSEDEEAWKAVEKLLDTGAKSGFLTTSITCPNDSNPTTEYEYTPLHYAAAKGLIKLVKELVEQQNVPVNIQTHNSKSTPLHLAASRGHVDVVKFLVDQGADPSIIDSEGGSALH